MCIFGAMDTQIIHAELTVEHVLQKWPHTFRFFLERHTKCPGCFLQRFCTLQDVAETYSIPVSELTNDLESCVNEKNQDQRSIP